MTGVYFTLSEHAVSPAPSVASTLAVAIREKEYFGLFYNRDWNSLLHLLLGAVERCVESLLRISTVTVSRMPFPIASPKSRCKVVLASSKSALESQSQEEGWKQLRGPG